MAELIASLTSGFSQVATDGLSAIGSITPVLIPVLGGVMVVGIGIKIAKKVVGR